MPIRRAVLRSAVVVILTLVCTQESGEAAVPAVPAVPKVPPSALDALAGPPAPADLDVMTFNLRYASTSTPNSWAERRPVMRALLTTEHPDLIGTQEGLTGQLSDLDADLGPGYARIGLGRDRGDVGEHTAIYYDTARLLPLHSGNYWLSTTPGVPGSKSWGTGHTRMVTWVMFADKRTGRHFYAVNTHLDNTSASARVHAAALIAQRLAILDPLPIVLTGDFNSPAEPTDEVYHQLVAGAGLTDSWIAAGRRGPSFGTIHNFQPPVPGGERYDWILTSPGVTAAAALTNTYQAGGQYPSDHFPVEARLRLP